MFGASVFGWVGVTAGLAAGLWAAAAIASPSPGGSSAPIAVPGRHCALLVPAIPVELDDEGSCGRRRHVPAQPGDGCFDNEYAQTAGLILLAALLNMMCFRLLFMIKFYRRPAGVIISNDYPDCCDELLKSWRHGKRGIGNEPAALPTRSQILRARVTTGG
jgi:hypothetical protein